MKRYFQSKSSLLGLAALLLLPVAGAWAQGAAAEAAPTKIAVMNVRQAIVSTAEGKQASAQLQSQFAPQQTDLENTQKQITDLQNRLANGARTLSDDEKARLQREGEMLSHQFQRKQDDLNEVVQAAQGDVVDTIGRKMLEVLDRYSREKGYAAVLDTSAQGTPVTYGSTPDRYYPRYCTASTTSSTPQRRLPQRRVRAERTSQQQPRSLRQLGRLRDGCAAVAVRKSAASRICASARANLDVLTAQCAVRLFWPTRRGGSFQVCRSRLNMLTSWFGRSVHCAVGRSDNLGRNVPSFC